MTRRSALKSLAVGLGFSLGTWARPSPAFAGRMDALTIKIQDEFRPLKLVVLHDGNNVTDLDPGDCFELAMEHGQHHPEGGPVDAASVVRELAALRQVLVGAGVRIVEPVTVDDAQSQLFVRETLFCVGETPYLGSMLEARREIELEGLELICKELPKLVDLANDELVLEGGDVLVMDNGKQVLVGTHKNTNELGFRELARSLKDQGAKAIAIPHHRLHLDCCLAPLPNGSALYQPRSISRKGMATLKTIFKEMIPLDFYESSRMLAANLLWLDPKRVISNVRAKKTNEKLKSMGYQVEALDFTNTTRMWGSFRCVTAALQRGA